MATLHDVLWNHHPYIRLYKRAHDVMIEPPVSQHGNVRARLHFTDGTDHWCYNLPTADEIATIIPGNGSEDSSDVWDIILRLQGGGLTHISHLSHAYSTLYYILLFPNGEEGWHPDIPL